MGGTSPSFKDFTGSRLQRYDTPESARRNRVTVPTATVHWFNGPPDATADKIKEVHFCIGLLMTFSLQLFSSASAPIPHTVTVFSARSERSLSGSAAFTDPKECTDALVLTNHYPMPTSSAFIFLAKKLTNYQFCSESPSLLREDGVCSRQQSGRSVIADLLE